MTTDKGKRTLWTAWLIAIMMLASLIVPITGAEKASAASKETSTNLEVECSATTQDKVAAKADQPLENKKNISAKYSHSTILNANKELWYRSGDSSSGQSVYAKATGVKKAYADIYLTKSNVATFFTNFNRNKAKKVTKKNVKDIGQRFVLLTNGKLIKVETNKQFDTSVKNWYEMSGSSEGWILKNNGNLFAFATDGTKAQVQGASNIKQMTYEYALDTGGALYRLNWDWTSFPKNVTATKVLDGVTALGEYGCIKGGKTYALPYWGDPTPVLDNELKDGGYKAYDGYNAGIEATGELLVDKTNRVYQLNEDTLSGTVTTEQLPGTFSSFTDYGYKTSDGKYYDFQGNATNVVSIKAQGTVCLKKDGILYRNGKKVLTNVVAFGSTNVSEEWIIARKDGTAWLWNSGQSGSSPKKITLSKTAAKKVTGMKAKAGKKQMTVKWKKVSSIAGYQITYARNAKFTKGKKNVSVGRKATKKIIKKLKSKKTYYVKMRAYKKSDGKKLYGNYSKVKKVKIK